MNFIRPQPSDNRHVCEGYEISAKYEDLLLKVVRHKSAWRVQVQEVDDPNSALSGGIDYATIEMAKRGGILIAAELFGTGVALEDLDWRINQDSDASK